jgi:4-hydroxy-tetrahydrodipicolinate synthase
MTDLRGVIAATPTPFALDGSVDFAWVEAHLAALAANRCDGVLIAGTTGEGPSLSLPERLELTDVVLRARGTLSVVIGCGTANLPDTVAAVRHAHSAGADAALVLPPFYFRHASPQGLFSYYAGLIERLDPDSNIGLYNIPQVSGVEISDELLERLLDRYPGRVEGIKDSSGVLQRTLSYIERYPALHIWAGGDRLTSTVLPKGAWGVMSATANWAPDLLQDVYKKVEAGAGAPEDQARLDAAEAVGNLIDPRAAIKYLARLRFGLPQTYVRPPLEDATEEQQQTLRAAYERLALPVLAG